MNRPTTFGRRGFLRLGGAAAVAAAAGGALGACGAGAPELEYMYWGSTAEKKAIEEMLASFATTRQDLGVRPVFTPDTDYDTKLNALVASGRVPDLAYVQPAMAYRLAEQGRLLDLTPYFDRYPGLGQRLPSTYYSVREGTTFGTQGANETMLMFYDRAAFAEAGVEPPPASAETAWDWDTYVAAAYRLTVDNNGVRPDEPGFDPGDVARFGTMANMWSAAWYGLLLSSGADVADESGTRTLLTSPESVQMFQDLVDLMHEHRVAPTPSQLGNNAPSLAVQLQSGRMAMALDGQWSLLDLNEADGLDFGIGVLPNRGTPLTATMGAPTAVFTDTEHVEDAVALYAYQSDPEQVGLFESGLWMPLEEKYYVEQEWIDKWTANPAHPPEYRTAVIDYTLHHSRPYYTQRLRNIEEIEKLITPATERIQTGEEPVVDVLAELAAKLDGGLLQGSYPSRQA